MVRKTKHVAMLIDGLDYGQNQKALRSYTLMRKKVLHDQSGAFAVSAADIRITRLGNTVIKTEKFSNNDVFAVNSASKLALHFGIRGQELAEAGHCKSRSTASVLLEGAE